MKDHEDVYSTLWDHLSALRKTFVRILAIIAAGFLFSFCFYEQLFQLLERPLKQTPKTYQDGLIHQTLKRERILNPSSQALIYQIGGYSHMIGPGGYVDIDIPSGNDTQLVIMGPLDGMLIAFKICFWSGAVLTAPFWGFALLQFLLPALKQHEKTLILPFIGLSIAFLLLGFLFAYRLTIPLANKYLLAFNAGIGMNLWSLSHYIDYTVVLLLGHAIAFEFCLILLFLVHLRVIGIEMMIACRRQMIVAAFVLGAILTPPDIFSQVMLAIPLIALYEVAILYARFREVAQKRENNVQSVH
jgi:sec-independent protein translocase protein TatC